MDNHFMEKWTAPAFLELWFGLYEITYRDVREAAGGSEDLIQKRAEVEQVRYCKESIDFLAKSKLLKEFKSLGYKVVNIERKGARIVKVHLPTYLGFTLPKD